MKADVARQSFPSVFTTYLLLLILGGIRAFVAAPAPGAGDELPGGGELLGGVVDAVLGAPGEWFAALAALCVAFITGLRVTRIATGSLLYVVRTFLPMVFFAVVAVGFYFSGASANAMICSLLFTSASACFVFSFSRSYCFGLVFQGGASIGVMPLLIPSMAMMWLAVPAALVIFRRSGREAIVCLVGLFAPLALYSYVAWIAGGDFLGAAMTIVRALAGNPGFDLHAMGAPRLVLSCLLILLMFLSVGVYAAMNMRTRPSRITAYFITAAVIAVAYLLLPCRSQEVYPLLAPSVALVAPLYMIKRKGMVPALLYGAILLAALAVFVIN